MKALLVAFSISCIWHLVFLFFIQAALPPVEIYQYNPQIRFLGEIFQSVRPHLRRLESRREMFFWNSMFGIQRDSAMQNPVLIPVATPQPVRTIELSLELPTGALVKKDVKEYNLLSESTDSDLHGEIKLDRHSNPVMVTNKFITGKLKQDFKNWFKLKAQIFYSPSRRDILFN